MKKIIAITLLAFTMAATLVGCGKKEDTGNSLESVQKAGKLVMGLDDAFPPMGFRNDEQEIVGFDIDVATEVCKRMGITLELKPIKWEAKEQELNTKHIDCIWNGFSVNAERAEKMKLSTPYMKNTQVAVVTSASGITSLEELAGKKVVIQNGSTASDAVENNQEFKSSLKELIKVDDNVQALMDLKVGGSNAVVMDEVVARYYVEKEPENYVILDTSLSEEEYAIGFRKNDKELCEEIEKHLKDMAADGTLKTLSEQWIGKDLTLIK